ncbi:hypothetical protein N7456_011383 [Penicillium angulare]|uniref:Uncharacterized protein n=1 Tax=Penicillium angulare TaxID=116970 RepID=A0A9W9K0M7_9EURO|nr:hypothetical protein N7456_011383 [Penicillium angulare]
MLIRVAWEGTFCRKGRTVRIWKNMGFGQTFKRYSFMDPAPLLQYVVEQLRHYKSTDLIVLEQLATSMAGMIPDNNLNDKYDYRQIGFEQAWTRLGITSLRISGGSKMLTPQANIGQLPRDSE